MGVSGKVKDKGSNAKFNSIIGNSNKMAKGKIIWWRGRMTGELGEE